MDALPAREAENEKHGGGQMRYRRQSEIRKERSSFGKEPDPFLIDNYTELQITVPNEP